jgi:hypothetical protein
VANAHQRYCDFVPVPVPVEGSTHVVLKPLYMTVLFSFLVQEWGAKLWLRWDTICALYFPDCVFSKMI